jgi:small subunit ribosomal protein S8
MSMTDPVADMLTRLRNAAASRHESVLIPASRMKISIAKVLKDEGFIRDFAVVEEPGKAQPNLRVDLSYGGRKQPVLNGLQRVSKPGLRVYVQQREIPRVYGGLGIAILSTPRGVMTGQEARRQHIGGELLCYVW